MHPRIQARMLINYSQNVLDVGTGTGIWAMYVGKGPPFLPLAHPLTRYTETLRMNTPPLRSSDSIYPQSNQALCHPISNSRLMMWKSPGYIRQITMIWSMCARCMGRSRTGQGSIATRSGNLIILDGKRFQRPDD